MKNISESVLKNVTYSKVLSMYNVVKGWMSSLEFYISDLHGLTDTLDRYLDEIIKHGNLDEVRECTMLLQDLRYSSRVLLKKVKLHLSELAEFKDKDKEVTPLLIKEYVVLKKKIGDFKEDFQEIKKEIFSIAEHVIQTNKEERLAVELEKIKVARNR